MIGLLFFVAVQASPTPPVMERAVPIASLAIPDEIAPAIVPYIRCLMASRGVPDPGAPGHGAVEPPSAAWCGLHAGAGRGRALPKRCWSHNIAAQA